MKTAIAFAASPTGGSPPEGYTPAAFASAGDVSREHLLPEPAQAFLLELRQQRDERGTLFAALLEKQNEIRAERHPLTVRRRQLVGPRGDGGHQLTDDHPAVAEVDAQLKRLDKKAALLESRQAQLPGASVVGIVQAIDRWLQDAYGRTLVMHEEPPPVLRKGETLPQAIEARRRRIRELAADRKKHETAPRPSTFAKEAIRAEIERHAEAGRPDVTTVIDHGERILWPRAAMNHASLGLLKSQVGDGETFDGLAVLAWLHKDELIKRLQADVDEIADDSQSLTDVDRARLIAEVDRDALAAAREEEALVRLALAQGLNVERRADADPRAVLQVEFSN